MKKTAWYPGDVRPARIGWYETSYWTDDLAKQFWTGAKWVWRPDDEMPTTMGAGSQNKWRGLAEPAK